MLLVICLCVVELQFHAALAGCAKLEGGLAVLLSQFSAPLSKFSAPLLDSLPKGGDLTLDGKKESCAFGSAAFLYTILQP